MSGKRKIGGEKFPALKKAKTSSSYKEDIKFSDLPNEIVIKIFEFLPQPDLLCGVCGVSKRFRGLGFDSIAEIDCDNFNDPQVVKRLVELCPRVRRVSKPTVDLAIQALRTCPMLESLKFVRKADSLLFCAIKDHGHSLRRLHVEDCTGLRPEIMKNLTDISLTSYRGLVSNVTLKRQIIQIGECCKGLERFALYCEHGSNLYRPKDGWKGLVTFLQKVRPTIKSLSFHETVMTMAAYDMLSECQKLEALEIKTRDTLSPNHLRKILQLPTLRELCIKENYAWNGAKFVKVFAKRTLTNLRKLSLRTGYGLDDEDLLVISRSCPELTIAVLDCSRWVATIGGIRYRPTGGVSDLGFRRSVLKDCVGLRELTVEGCNNLTADAFAGVEECLPDLRELSVLGCSKITGNLGEDLRRLGIAFNIKKRITRPW